MSYDEFQKGLQDANMPILPREFETICKELDPQKTSFI